MDYVLHQAAIPSVPRSVDKPAESHRANVDATLQPADRGARRRRQAPGLRGLVVRLRRHRGAAEDRDDADQSAVAVRAAEADGREYGQMFTRLYGFETVTTRYFNVFGPRQDPGLAVLGRDFAVHQGAARRTTQPVIYGDGEQTRDFTYVANVVDGVMRAAETPGVGGRGDQRRDQRPHLAERAAGDAEQDLRHQRRADLQGSARAATCAIRRPTSRKAEKLLGYKPTSVSKRDCARR